MRPVNKGAAPRTYTCYQDARDDLFKVIGWYCSFCEMPIKNMPEVEHMLPTHNGGAVLDWNNFLISCKYCNTVKRNNNTSLNGYYWPDRDNTLRAFKYHPNLPIEPSADLADAEKQIAQSTILLCGINREPGSNFPPTQKDTRWKSRREAWQKAMRALDGWLKVRSFQNNPPVLIGTLAMQIADTASGEGHFSIWMEVFREEPYVRQKILEKFLGTATDCFDAQTQPLPRPNGNL